MLRRRTSCAVIPDASVVLDGRTYLRGYQVDDLRALGEAVGEPARVIECVCADEVVRARLERDRVEGKHPAGNRTYEMYLWGEGEGGAADAAALVLDTGVCECRGVRAAESGVCASGTIVGHQRVRRGLEFHWRSARWGRPAYR